ncbi:MAG: hypothetical protein L0226_14635 [Acidobacteria bacterium]|nr:hypothetical protein [Acidobacteriota bacterium]
MAERCPTCGRKWPKENQSDKKNEGSSVNLNALWIGGALILLGWLVYVANTAH